MQLILEKDRELPLKLTKYDYSMLAQEITGILAHKLLKKDRELIEGVIYAELHKQIEEFSSKLRAELIQMIKDEFKILKRRI